jgi:hypothetical protein
MFDSLLSAGRASSLRRGTNATAASQKLRVSIQMSRPGMQRSLAAPLKLTWTRALSPGE